uniref:Uncharacterized protein n=1 Tax=Setaria italica TaxID=4555 RepID=K4A426_SETIT
MHKIETTHTHNSSTKVMDSNNLLSQIRTVVWTTRIEVTPSAAQPRDKMMVAEERGEMVRQLRRHF